MAADRVYDSLVRTVNYRVDDLRDGWSLTEYRPGHLAGFVESIWHFEGAMPYVRERHLPDGAHFLRLLSSCA
jgi:hypothetical protein